MEPRAFLRALMARDGDNTHSLSVRLKGRITQPQVYKYLSGTAKEPRRSTLQPLAEHYGVAIEAFYDQAMATAEAARLGLIETGHKVEQSVAPYPIDLDAHPELTRIRSVKLKLRGGIAGYAVEPDDSEGLPIFFRADWMAQRGFKPYELLAIKVKGHSMEPSLHEGDMVVINTADVEPRDGEVFSVNYEGEAVVKRLVRDGGEWWLVSDNPDQRRYPRKKWLDGDSFIVGRVVHKQSERI